MAIDLATQIRSFENYLRQLDPKTLSTDEKAALKALFDELVELLKARTE